MTPVRGTHERCVAILIEEEKSSTNDQHTKKRRKHQKKVASEINKIKASGHKLSSKFDSLNLSKKNPRHSY
jgi:hypothetical protein